MKNHRKIEGYTYKMTQVLVAVGPRIQFLLIRIHFVCMCVCARASVRMFVAYSLCSLYCCLLNFVPHITYLSRTE